MQQHPESERNHPLISLLFPHLPTQRFSWRAFLVMSVGTFILLALIQLLIGPPTKKPKPSKAQPAIALDK